MSTITKERLTELSRRENVGAILGEEIAELARIALASLEAEASGRNPVLAYADSYRNMANQGVESIPVWSVITDLERNIAPLFTAPPAPISVPAAMEMDDDFDSAFEHGKAVGWNAYRAAMLQGAETVQGWIPCSERMPSAGEKVLAYRPDAPESNDPLIKMATYVGGSAHGHGFDCYCKPTHWMPLPAAPQQEDNNG
ncbi:DUF551 domain-containing protein [Enterobacter hormaechei]|uniref:DUF551 domain-containing protein n=1 Tax=Enterobacter hormaechei TaxID=158836 RepID=UPI0030B293B1